MFSLHVYNSNKNSISENKLKQVKSQKKITSKTLIADIESLKNDQLFKLLSNSQEVPLTKEEQKFENDFVQEETRLDKTIEPSLIRKKIAPQTCAINKSELASIVKYDLTQKLHEFYRQLDETDEDRKESFQILQDIQSVGEELSRQKKKSKHWVKKDLTKLLPLDPSNRANVFEVACSDACLELTHENLAILVVFWIEVNKTSTPTKCFGTIFRVYKNLEIKLAKFIEAPSMIGYCRLTDRRCFIENQLCLLVFSKGAEVSAYTVKPDCIEQIEDVFEWFPSLALTKLPGGAVNSSCRISGGYRFSAVGLDTGILIVSVCVFEGNVILDSIRLKFGFPMTVVEFLPEIAPNVQRILLSSYMGPAAIWRIHFENDKLRYEPESILDDSQYHDSVLCACIYRFYHGAPPWILLGTYSGKILRYKLPMPTTNVRKTERYLKMIGTPFMALKNKPIYSIKQSGLNEISVTTPFGMTVLREDINGFSTSPFVKALENYQWKILRKNKKKRADFDLKMVQRISMESDSLECRPRAGSTVSSITNRTLEEELIATRRRMTMPSYTQGRPSPLMSANNSSSKLKQLDLNTAEIFYQDGPNEPGLEMRSPTKSAQTSSPRMGPIQEAGTSSPNPTESRRLNIFRFASKKSLSQSDQPLGRVFK
ncbi:unnamed protein product [Caenorhabditis bovis]|uniref:Uncharacterized protein n=1 Tax=Caenorhabditis bovis TaxID=2654633 RepID=A0A8S1ED28_9PELO|nr:unnamed protein product [Caenorhabditis bovis]